MSRETLGHATGRADAASASGVVVVVHGGQSVSTEPTSPVQLSVVRMIPTSATSSPQRYDASISKLIASLGAITVS